MTSAVLTPAAFSDSANNLIAICHFIGARNWAPATGGNFSVRVDDRHCLITRSGCDKSQLTIDDLLVCDFDGKAQDPMLKPSAETALHTRLYQRDNAIGAVLHTHSVSATLLSRATVGDVSLHGYEMQKALRGNVSHQTAISIAVFDNDQNIAALADKVEMRWSQGLLTQPGFLVRGHGLYAWGKDLIEARRHIEGFEFLFECAWQERLLKE